MAMEQVIVELQHARSPAAPAKVDAGAGSPPALLPPGERRALGKNWEAERGRPRDGELGFIYFPPLWWKDARGTALFLGNMVSRDAK